MNQIYLLEIELANLEYELNNYVHHDPSILTDQINRIKKNIELLAANINTPD